MNAKHKLFLVFILSMISFQLKSQQHTGADSLLLVAMKDIYNQPQKSLEIGNELLPQSGKYPKFQIRLYMMMAQASVMLPDYEKSLEYANKAMEIAKKNNDYPNQVLISNFLGTHYLRLNLREKAWRALEETEKLIVLHPLPDSLMHLNGNVFMLRAYLSEEEDCKGARKYFDKAIQVFRQSENVEFSDINLGVAYTHKGRCYLKENQTDSAKLSFYKAIGIASEIKNDGVNAFAHLSLASAYFQEKDYRKSNEILFDALHIASRSSQMELVKETYKSLAENYFQLNDLDSYAKYDKLYQKALEDFNRSEKNSVGDISQNLNNEEKKATSSEKGNNIIFIIGGAILLLISAFFFIRSYIIRKRMK